MMNLCNNNFKYDFEKSGQSIDLKTHRDDVKDAVADCVENGREQVSDKQDEQFPPRNAQRRQRRRDTATHQNEGNEPTVDEKNDTSSQQDSKQQQETHSSSKTVADETNKNQDH